MKEFNQAREKIAMELGFAVVGNKGAFLTLERDGYHVQMKQYMTPSAMGYKGGRIDELKISKGDEEYLWSNGWADEQSEEGEENSYKKPTDPIVLKLVEDLDYLN